MDLTLKHILVAAIVLGTIFVIISENRNPAKTIAWCLLLMFMPVIGLLLYIVFGMDSRHRRMIKDEDLNHFKGITEIKQSEDITTCVQGQNKPLGNNASKGQQILSTIRQQCGDNDRFYNDV